MTYKVVRYFIDKNNRQPYKVGDVFSVDGLSKERIEELTTENNALGEVLIEKVKQTRRKRPQKKSGE